MWETYYNEPIRETIPTLRGVREFLRMLFEDLKNLNTVEIKEEIVRTDGEERLFYVHLLNKVMQLRREETLKKEKELRNNKKLI